MSKALDLARAYRNNLVALELRRRDSVAEIVRRHEPRIGELEAEAERIEQEIEAHREKILAENTKQRKRNPDKEAVAAVRALRKRLKEVRAEHRVLRRDTYSNPTVRESLASLDSETRTLAKALRATCGLHWGSYLTVEQGLLGIRSGPPPHRFRGESHRDLH